MRLAHWGKVGSDGNADAWNHAYVTEGGTVVWNDTSHVTGNPYGGTVDYQVYKVKASYTLSADQAAAEKTGITKITGLYAAISGTGFKIWSAEKTAEADPINSNGTSSSGASAGTSNLAISDIELTLDTAGIYDLYSATYIAVMVDGESVTTNGAVTGTLSFSESAS